MHKAWHRGISTAEFRKSLTSDLNFIFELDKVYELKQEEKEREQQIQNAMNQLKSNR